MPNPQVVYTANIRLGGGGMGNSVLEMLKGLHQAGLIKQVIVSSCKAKVIPRNLITTQGLVGRVQKRLAFYDRTGWGDFITNRIFDLWTSRVMQRADLFESWTGFCLTSLQTARERGMQTLLNLGSAHPSTQIELINAERLQWGLKPIRETSLVHQVEKEIQVADRIIVQSRFSERTLTERGVPVKKLVRIPLGVDTLRFRPIENMTPHPFRVLFLGQVTLRKGVPYLLEVWKKLGWHDAELWLVGQVMADCQSVLQKYSGLPGLVVRGHSTDPASRFQASDVFVSPSVEDGFGLVVTEAMACGLPVVVSDHTGAADLVNDGENGFVVTYNDIAQYTNALETLRANPPLTRRMGQAARAIAQQYSWDVYRKNLAEFHLGVWA